jgi:hypothetical protein
MGFRRSDMQEAFFVASEASFRVWGYATTDPLEEVLRPGYFGAASSGAREGELIYVRMQAQAGAPWRGGSSGPVHMALLMLVPGAPGGGPAVRLVQDFGSSAEPAGLPETQPLRLPLAGAPQEPAPAKRGRPAGSRARKPPSNGHDAGPTAI